MKMVIDKKELLAAVDKAAVGCKDTFIFTVSDRKTAEGKVFATVSASNGNVQGMATFFATSDSTKQYSFIVGMELFEVLKAVGEFGDEFTINVTDTVAEITAGTATMPLALKTDGTRIKMQTPKDSVCWRANVEREAFVKAVRQGSFAYGDATASSNLASTVALVPETVEDVSRMYFISSDGRFATRSQVAVVQADEEYKKVKDQYISIDAPAARSICNKLESDKVDLLIFNKQVSIRDGNDFYTIVRYETEFPKAVGQLLNTTEYSYKAVFDVPTLKAAIRVATVLEEKKQKKFTLCLENNQATISSVLGKNKATVKAEDLEGEVSINVNAKHFETALADIGTSKITVYGQGDLKPLFLTADGVNVLTAPFKKNEEE